MGARVLVVLFLVTVSLLALPGCGAYIGGGGYYDDDDGYYDHERCRLGIWDGYNFKSLPRTVHGDGATVCTDNTYETVTVRVETTVWDRWGNASRYSDVVSVPPSGLDVYLDSEGEAKLRFSEYSGEWVEVTNLPATLTLVNDYGGYYRGQTRAEKEPPAAAEAPIHFKAADKTAQK